METSYQENEGGKTVVDFETFWRTSWEIQKMLNSLRFWRKVKELLYKTGDIVVVGRCCLECRLPSLKEEIHRSKEECRECVLSYTYGCFQCDLHDPRLEGDAGCALAQRISTLRRAVGLMINLVPYKDGEGHMRLHMGFMFIRKFPKKARRKITEKFRDFGLKYRERVWGREFKRVEEAHRFFELCYEEIVELVPKTEKAWTGRIPTPLSELFHQKSQDPPLTVATDRRVSWDFRVKS